MPRTSVAFAFDKPQGLLIQASKCGFKQTCFQVFVDAMCLLSVAFIGSRHGCFECVSLANAQVREHIDGDCGVERSASSVRSPCRHARSDSTDLMRIKPRL